MDLKTDDKNCAMDEQQQTAGSNEQTVPPQETRDCKMKRLLQPELIKTVLENLIQDEQKDAFEKRYKALNSLIQHRLELVKEDRSWIYKWMWDLNEIKLVNDYAVESSQAKLRRHLPNDMEWYLRRRLAFLQTKTPAWTLLDCIVESAEELSREVDKRAKKRKKRGKFKETATSALANFVTIHVLRMLNKLYDDIAKEEVRLTELHPGTTLKDEEHLDHCVALLYTDPIMQSALVLDSTSDADPNTRRYSLNTEVPPISRKVTLLGPVGERPLHICSLKAAEFFSIELYGKKFVSQGILQAMKIFIKDSRRAPQGENGDIVFPPTGTDLNLKDELRCQYGKDYCAAVCNFLHVRARSYQQASHLGSWKDFAGELTADTNPLLKAPYWRELCDWAAQKAWELKDFPVPPRVSPAMVAKRVQSSDQGPGYGCWTKKDGSTETINRSDLIKYVKLTQGLYEGETIMFPRIAIGDLETVKFLLEQEDQLVNKDGKVIQVVGSDPKDKFINIRATGLFFRPKYPSYISSVSLLRSYLEYAGGRLRVNNEHASSPNKYFGTRPLDFAVSQGEKELVTLLLDQTIAEFTKIMEKKPTDLNQLKDQDKSKLVLKAILDAKDEFGNTLLHLAAWNGQKDMFDYLVKLGADRNIVNSDGMTPFALTARFGLWEMFEYIWNKHLSQKIWVFGQTEAIKIDISDFDWQGLGSFSDLHEIETCINMLLTTWITLHDALPVVPDQKRFEEMRRILNLEAKQLDEKKFMVRCRKEYQRYSGFRPGIASGTPKGCQFMCTKLFPSESWSEHLNAVRIITLYRPQGWYKAAASHVEEVLMKKWQRCYQFVYLGNTLIPYCIIVLLFGLMWEKRQIHVLDHRFWWAKGSVWAPRPDPTVEAPAEFGTIFGRLSTLGGPESACGWTSMKSSQSGRLQMALFIYGVPSLIQLAYAQRRIRPSDLDLDGSLTISVPEIVNFIYLNLESLFHLILAGLLTTMFAYRIGAGVECQTDWLRVEKNVTSIAALVLFCNLFIVLKPIKNIGLFILAMYRFLATDVLSFLIMYSMFFAAFLIALQTLHNANVYYLTWFENNLDVWPQIKTATNGMAYMNGQNSPPGPDDPITILSADVMMSGCSAQVHTIYDTAFALLSISLGDGFGDAIQQARSSKFDCAGFRPDLLIAYILVLWVFLTNVLQLNMLLAMMNWTFENQKDHEKEIWLLDVSYRILRYEHSFPELTNHAHKWKPVYGLFTYSFWHTALTDLFLTIYCMPEIQLILIIGGNCYTTFLRVPGATMQTLVPRFFSVNSKRVWSRVLFMRLNSRLLPWFLNYFRYITQCCYSFCGKLVWSADHVDYNFKLYTRRLSLYVIDMDKVANLKPDNTSVQANIVITPGNQTAGEPEGSQSTEALDEDDPDPLDSGERHGTLDKHELESRLWCFMQHPLLIRDISNFLPANMLVDEKEARYITTTVLVHHLLMFRNLYNETRCFNRIGEVSDQDKPTPADQDDQKMPQK